MNKIFMSHSSLDKPLIRTIRKALLPFKNELWLDELKMVPGDSLREEISNGISDSDKVLIFISKDSVNSDWVKEEMQISLSKEASGSEPLVIPVIIDGTDTPIDLKHKLYIKFDPSNFAEGIAKILKGIKRQQSIIVVEPTNGRPFDLDPFADDLNEFKDKGLEGDIFLVYNLYDFIKEITAAIIPDEEPFHYSDTLKNALPLCIDNLLAITPNLIRTVLTYYKNDAGGTFAAEQTVRLVWRMIMLVLFNNLIGKIDESKLNGQNLQIYKAGKLEVSRLNSIKSEYILPNYHLGMINLVWLEHLNVHMDLTYDIGFQGVRTKNGIQIDDVSHVRIPKEVMRKDNLIFVGSQPKYEFFPATWVRYVLPFIVAKSTLDYSFEGLSVFESTQEIGLQITDYIHFGVE